MARLRVAAAAVALVMVLPSAWAAGDEAPIVRPGSGIQIDGEGVCTLGFLFEQRSSDGGPSTFWGMTAGHCVLEKNVASKAWPRGGGPQVTLFDTTWLGEARFAHAERGLRLDFALVELDAQNLRLDPQACFWGGPTALHSARSSEPQDVMIFGHGLEVEPRQLRVDSLSGELVEYTGASYQGDSGGPVLSQDGRALGVTHTVGVSNHNARVWTGEAVRLDRQLQWIEQNLGLELDLLTAPWRNRQWPQDLVGYSEPGCYKVSPVG
jgi:hypothetical protein